jgi:hypothetical protein
MSQASIDEANGGRDLIEGMCWGDQLATLHAESCSRHSGESVTPSIQPWDITCPRDLDPTLGHYAPSIQIWDTTRCHQQGSDLSMAVWQAETVADFWRRIEELRIPND